MSLDARDAVGPACAAVSATVADPPPVDLGGPTPCSGFDVRALVRHFMGTSGALARLGLGEPLDPEDPWGATIPVADDDWVADLRRHLADIGRGWSRAEAWEGDAQVGGSAMPRAVLGQMALIEVVAHGWDLARSLGRTVELDPLVADAVDAAVAGTADLGRQMGAYGPEVDVPAGSPGLDRALGRAGRDPAWSPPG